MSSPLDRFKRLDHRPLVLGHRGARKDAPENTLLAFELCRQQGGDGVELDVQSSADGVPFVVHDLDLARVSEGRETARVCELTADELARVDVGGGQNPPRLEAVLDWAERHSMALNVELKTPCARRDGIAQAVAALLQDRSELAVLVSSFHPLLLRSFKQAAPQIPTAWLFTQSHVRWACLAKPLGVNAVHPDARCFQARTGLPRAAGMLVNTWTVNDPEAARMLANRGVDAIITDVPGEILRALSPSLLETVLAGTSDDVSELA